MFLVLNTLSQLSPPPHELIACSDLASELPSSLTVPAEPGRGRQVYRLFYRVLRAGVTHDDVAPPALDFVL